MWDDAKHALSFVNPAAPTTIEARLLDEPAPARAKDLAVQPALLTQLGFLKIEDEVSAHSSPYGWDALLEVLNERKKYAFVFTAVHRHGERSLICWAQVIEPAEPGKISRAEVANVCGTLAAPVVAAADHDRDGVADADDACPGLAEVRDGNDDDDGCPDSVCSTPQGCFDEGAAAFRAKDYAGSFAAQRRACDRGHGLGCSAVGDLYTGGKVIRFSYEAAAIMYRKACGLDNGNGCNNLGGAQERGLGIERDVRAAEAAYAQACKLIPKSVACTNAEIMQARREGRER